jgi:zinc transport system permease protein
MEPGLFSAFHYEFMRNALLAGLLAAVLCGVIGPFVVVKRLAFISDGISHAAFGGMGICFFFGLDPLLGAVAVALTVAGTLGLSDSSILRSHDALIGVLWAAGMAVGIVFVYKTPGYAPNLMSYLFGNILMVSRRDIGSILALSAVVFLLLALFWKGLVAVSFDEVFARVQGAPVRFLLTLLLAAIALSVVTLIQVVGTLLVVALLTIPPMAGLALSQSLRGVLVVSVATGVGMTLGGLALSYAYDLPSGPAIILLGAAFLAALYAGRRLRSRYSSRSTSMP